MWHGKLKEAQIQLFGAERDVQKNFGQGEQAGCRRSAPEVAGKREGKARGQGEVREPEAECVEGTFLKEPSGGDRVKFTQSKFSFGRRNQKTKVLPLCVCPHQQEVWICGPLEKPGPYIFH